MQPDVSPWVVRGLYLLATILFCFPLVDLGAAIWPLDPGELPWRYAALGLTASYLHIPILGLAVAVAVAHWQGHSSRLRLAGAFGIVVALVLLPLMAVFALDSLAMLEMRPEELRRDTAFAGVVQALKYLLASGAVGLLGLGALKTGAARAKRRATGAPGVLRRSSG